MASGCFSVLVPSQLGPCSGLRLRPNHMSAHCCSIDHWPQELLTREAHSFLALPLSSKPWGGGL
jgi:hypothetical protein